jgi:nucleosome-remodeling factor subunit BPTF
VYLKKLPENVKKKRTQVKYPMTATFKSAVSKQPSILILPEFELKKLARTGGRQFSPAGFAAAPKPGSWGWSYPCGRPLFKTCWQYKAVHASTLAASAMQLRIMWACVRWDDIQV